jgi:predicted Zn-dependent protease
VTPSCYRSVSIIIGLFAISPVVGDEPVTAQSSSEEHIWADGRDEEEALLESGFVIDAPEVEAYLQGVIARLVEAEGLDPESFTVKVIRDTSLNAFALPHGVVFIHSGLLARMTNEAQLAAILGHEITHVTHHHGYRGVKDHRTKGTMLAIVNVGSGAAGNYGSLVQILGDLGATAAVSGYSRALEREADKVGWQRMLDAGYNLDAAPEVFRILMADIEQNERTESFFFGTHPRLQEREENFMRMNDRNKLAVGEELGEDRFNEGILPILAVNGELEMKAGRWTAARDQLWRYRVGNPDDVKARWLIAETERRAGTDGDIDEARDLLIESIALDPEFAPAHRTLGLIYYKEENWESAARHLRLYLDLDTGAHDRAFLQAYLEECKTELAPNT